MDQREERRARSNLNTPKGTSLAGSGLQPEPEHFRATNIPAPAITNYILFSRRDLLTSFKFSLAGSGLQRESEHFGDFQKQIMFFFHEETFLLLSDRPSPDEALTETLFFALTVH